MRGDSSTCSVKLVDANKNETQQGWRVQAESKEEANAEEEGEEEKEEASTEPIF